MGLNAINFIYYLLEMQPINVFIFPYGAPATAHIILGNQKARRELWKTSAGGSTVPFPQAHHTTTQS